MPEPAHSDSGSNLADEPTTVGSEPLSVDIPHLVELAAVAEPEYVEYLGVRLPKGTGEEEQVPLKKEGYVEDEFSQELQRDLATAFALHQPVFVEAGTSVGKSSAVRKMAHELGWSVHYINMKGSDDTSSLMGQYAPNPDRHSTEDPEYVFANGPVTAAIEEAIKGHKVLLMVDEFNAATPDILIRLHEVIDAYEDSGMVSVTEDASKRLKVVRDNLSIVALGNAPSRSGSEYSERHPLDPAQFRRWVYIKLPEELPEESVEGYVDATFGLKKGTEVAEPDESKYLHSGERTLTREELGAIPGMADMAEQIRIFHYMVKSQAKASEIGRDQPQKISYDDREEINRVAEFICHFYNGDLNATVHRALEYYYANKLADPTERQEMIGKIHTIKVEDTGDSRRRGVSGSTAELPNDPETLSDPDYIARRLAELQVFIGPAGPAKDPLILTALAGNNSLTARPMRQVAKDKPGNTKAFGKSLAGVMGTFAESEINSLLLTGKHSAGFNGLVGHDAIAHYGGEDLFIVEIKSKIDSFDEQDINAIITSLAGLSQTPELVGLMMFLKEAGKKPSATALGMRYIKYPNTPAVKLDILERDANLFGLTENEKTMAIAWAISGDDSNVASEVRNQFIEDGYEEALAISLAGLDTGWAWEIREVLKGRVSNATFAKSMSGCFSLRAWQEREEHFASTPDYYAMSIGNNWVLQALSAVESLGTTSSPASGVSSGSSSPIGTPIAGSAFAPAGSPISPPPSTSSATDDSETDWEDYYGEGETEDEPPPRPPTPNPPPPPTHSPGWGPTASQKKKPKPPRPNRGYK